MKFVTLDKLPFRELKEGVRQKAVWGENIMITHMEMAPGAEIPDHHHIQEQVSIIVSGSAQVTIQGQTLLMKEGDVYIIEDNERHSLVALESGAVIQNIFSPIREEFIHPTGTEKHYSPR